MNEGSFINLNTSFVKQIADVQYTK